MTPSNQVKELPTGVNYFGVLGIDPATEIRDILNRPSPSPPASPSRRSSRKVLGRGANAP